MIMPNSVRSQISAARPAQAMFAVARFSCFRMAVVCCLFAVSGRAQQFAVDRLTLAGGGGASTNTNFHLAGTVAQPDATFGVSNGVFSVEGGFWVTAIAVQSLGAPSLRITPSGSSAVLSWNFDYAGFVVEVSDSIRGGWQTLGFATSVVGATHSVTVSLTPNLRYYRLRWFGLAIPVQLPGLPLLSVYQLRTTTVLSWDAAQTGYEVDVSDNVVTWQPLGVTPTIAGGNWLVTVPASSTVRFYRLRKL